MKSPTGVEVNVQEVPTYFEPVAVTVVPSPPEVGYRASVLIYSPGQPGPGQERRPEVVVLVIVVVVTVLELVTVVVSPEYPFNDRNTSDERSTRLVKLLCDRRLQAGLAKRSAPV
jgi:hypothetical protein